MQKLLMKPKIGAANAEQVQMGYRIQMQTFLGLISRRMAEENL